MPISFFSPIHSSVTHPLEKCAFLRPAVNFFNHGQKAYSIRHYDNNSKIELMKGKRTPPTWIGTLLRIIAIFTVIIPFLMMLGTVVYRAVNNFVAYHPSNTFNNLPKELLGKIFQMTGPSILQLYATNKTNKEIIDAKLEIEKSGKIVECDNPLKKSVREYQLILRVLKEIYQSSDDREIKECFADFLAQLNPRKALNLGFLDKHLQSTVLVTCSRNLAMSNPSKALKLVKRAIMLASRPSMVLINNVIKVLTLLDPEYAVEFAKTLPDKTFEISALALVAKIKLASDREIAIRLIERILILNPIDQLPENKSIENFKALGSVVEVLALLDRKRGLELADQAMQMANSMNLMTEKFRALGLISKVLSTFDSTKAAEVLKSALADYVPEDISEVKHYQRCTQGLALLSPHEAAAVADFAVGLVKRMQDNFKPAHLTCIAAGLCKSNPEKAQEVIDLAIGILDTIPRDRLVLRCMVFAGIAKILVMLNDRRADEMFDKATLIANSIENKNTCWGALAFIAQSLAVKDLQKAVDMAKTILDPLIQKNCLFEVVNSKIPIVHF